jgi:hypothetical protein
MDIAEEQVIMVLGFQTATSTTRMGCMEKREQ